MAAVVKRGGQQCLERLETRACVSPTVPRSLGRKGGNRNRVRCQLSMILGTLLHVHPSITVLTVWHHLHGPYDQTLVNELAIVSRIANYRWVVLRRNNHSLMLWSLPTKHTKPRHWSDSLRPK